MSKLRPLIIVAVFLSGCLSCSKQSKVTSREEYPDFSEPAKPKAVEKNITLCSSKPMRPHYHVVEIRQMKFQPAELALKKGDTVVWMNCDITNHDVTEEKKKAWQSPPLATNQSWMKVVSENADYYCSIHVVMNGKSKVE